MAKKSILTLRRCSAQQPVVRTIHFSPGFKEVEGRQIVTRVLAASLCFLLPLSVQAQSDVPDAPAVPAAISAPIDPLNELVEKAISTTSKRFLDTEVHTPWQIIHGLLALRQDYVIKVSGTPVSAIDWISNGATYRGTPWFQATTDGGRTHPYNGTPYEFEGHVNQFLSIIAMCNLPLDHQFQAGGGKVVTMQDMVNHAKMNVNSREEITWTLWFLSQYVDQDEEWFNNLNEPWSMERLVRMQVKASPYDAPCGGTHGMFALAFARNAYEKKHGELRGAWLEADQKLQRYLMAAQRMQNRDGSFATDWFKATGYSTEFNERIKYSGHMLEWILVTLPQSRFQESWIRTGVQTLCQDMIQNAHEPSECGPLYHALHALVLYRQLMNSTLPSHQDRSLARAVEPQAKVSMRSQTPQNSTPQNLTSQEISGSTKNSPAKPVEVSVPQPPVIAPPVRMATPTVAPELNRRQQRIQQRRTSSLEGSEMYPDLQGNRGTAVLMPILNREALDKLATAIKDDEVPVPAFEDE